MRLGRTEAARERRGGRDGSVESFCPHRTGWEVFVLSTLTQYEIRSLKWENLGGPLVSKVIVNQHILSSSARRKSC